MAEPKPGRMPEDMPDRMPDRMPEDMSNRMPEDLPVKKCINVMVGITRSKVILLLVDIVWRCVYKHVITNNIIVLTTSVQDIMLIIQFKGICIDIV
jgi:hypothetical protein